MLGRTLTSRKERSRRTVEPKFLLSSSPEGSTTTSDGMKDDDSLRRWLGREWKTKVVRH
jgi:hypothetical protein